MRRLVLSAVAASFLSIAGIASGVLAASEDTIVVAISADPGHLNPAITTGSNVHTVADSIFNGLVALDQDLTPLPDLAESWSVSDDATEFTFQLAKDVRWHDGAPFTSADVKFTFEEVLFKYHSRTKAGLGEAVQAIETPDEHTVVFKMKEPYGPLLQRLDVTEAPILPKHIYSTAEDPNQHAANLQPVGTGPFRFVSYDQGESVTLERNPAYFKPNLPHIDKVIFRIIPDSTTQVLALSRGEVDYVSSLPLSDIERLQADGGVQLVERSTGPGGGNCIMTVSFNLERPLWAQREMRQAFAQAVDRQRLVDQVLYGWGAVANAPISSGIGWAHAAKTLAGYVHDPKKAETLLDAAGHHRGPGGQRFSIDMIHFPVFDRYVQAMKQDLAQVGIDLISRPLDPAAAVDAIFHQRDFDTNLISYCNGADPDIGVARMYVSSNIGPIPFSNGSAYRNDRVDELFAAAARSADRDERREMYHEVQGILAADLPYWWLVETRFVTGYRDTLTGFTPWSGQFAEQAKFK